MKTVLFLIALALALAATANAETPVVGQETAVASVLANGAMPVFLPANYDAAKAWPVIFFYPGQGSQPGTATMRRFTGDRDFIVVGLPFADGGPSPSAKDAPPRYVENLGNQLATARAWLTNHAHVDQNRIFLGGISKGGWTTSLVGEPELQRLAGLIILLAGRSYPALAAPGGTAYRGKAIYIGDGEMDNNMRPARQAAEFFLRQGAVVTFEEFPGLGHELPDDAASLRAWLEVQKDPRADQTAWLVKQIEIVKVEKDSTKKYRELRAIALDPRLSRASIASRTEVQKLTMDAVKVSPGREESSAERLYRQWIWGEATIRRLEDMKAVRDGFQQLVQAFPETKWGRLAAEDFKAVDVAYQKSVVATQVAQAGMAVSRTNAVRNVSLDGQKGDRPAGPKFKGNKIIFQR